MPQLHSIESKGLAAELVGLVLLLVATLWQVSVTDWMDGFPAKSQYYIQETANLAILLAQSKTADAMREGNSERRNRLLDEVDTISRKAMFELVSIRTSVDSVVSRQGTPLKAIRHVLFVIGAVLIVIGKGLILLHKNTLAKATSQSAP